jgi:hypothetical protein
LIFFIADPKEVLQAFPGWMEVGEKALQAGHPATGKDVLTWAPVPKKGAVPEPADTAPADRPLFAFWKTGGKQESPAPLDKRKFKTFATGNIDYGLFPALLAAALGRACDDVLPLQFDKPALISPRRPREELYEANREFVRKAAEWTDGGRNEWIETWRKKPAEAGCGISAAEAGYALGKSADLAREAESPGQSMYCSCAS